MTYDPDDAPRTAEEEALMRFVDAKIAIDHQRFYLDMRPYGGSGHNEWLLCQLQKMVAEQKRE